MDFSFIFGLLSGFIAIFAYGFYFKQILAGQSTPNPASWGIWLTAGVLNAITYFAVTEGNIWQSMIVLAVAFSTGLIFVYSLFRGKFTRVSTVEIIALVLALAIGIFWQLTSDDRLSNLFLQGVYIISFIPTIIGIASGKARENHVSWSVVFVAYVFAALSVAFGSHPDWVAFVNPLVNGVLCTGIVIALILYKNHHERVT